MRILILMNVGNPQYELRKELFSELISAGHIVTVSFLADSYIPKFIDLGCTFVETPINRRGTNPLGDVKLFFSYLALIRSSKPDLVLTYTIKPNVYGGLACQLTKTPYLANITGLGTAVEHGGLMSKFTTMLYKIGLGKCDCIFFQNTENRAYFEKNNIHGKKTRLIPGSGVNLTSFESKPYPSSNTCEFLFIARIMKEKGIDQYLEAAEYIRGKYPHTRFHICGFCEESYEERLTDLQARGIVIYHGMVSNIKEMYSQVHCTIHPTYYPEGLSNVLLESCATARPIITTDRSGCREVVEGGVNGYIVKQQDSQDLIEKIERFLALSQGEKTQMGLNGRTKVEREFDRQIVVNAYLDEIRKLRS